MNDNIKPDDETKPDDGIQLTDEQKRRRRSRSIAIAVGLAVLVMLFYLITIFRMGSGVTVRPL